MNRIILIFIMACTLSGVKVYGQFNDIGAVGSVSVSKDVGKGIDVTLGQEFRINQNLTTFDRSLTSLGVDYKVYKKLLKVEANYDFIRQNQIEYFETRQRISTALSTQLKWLSIGIKIRTKGQMSWRDESRGDYKINPKYMWRNKLEFDYSIFGSPLKPYVSGEIFCPLNGADGFYLNEYRTVMGLKYRMSRRTTLDFMLRYDQEVQQANPKSALYGGIGWNYDL